MARLANSLKISLDRYLDVYLQEVKAGIRCTEKGHKFSVGSIYIITRTVSIFKEFEKETNNLIDWKDINMQFYYRFVQYLRDKGLRQNTIGKYLGTLKTILSNAESDGYNKYYIYRNKRFKIGREPSTAIYLSHEELMAIEAVDLSGLPEVYSIARDIFLIGVFTAQRYSDYSTIRKSSIGYVSNKHPVLFVTQKKTGKRVCIPCNKDLISLLAKYDFNLPHIWTQHFNRYIKVVAQKAGLGERAQFVSSHTARRTGATLLYLAGMDLLDIMKITGHSSSAMLKLYIKADELEVAEKLIKKYPFFK